MVYYLLGGFVNPVITRGFDIHGARALDFDTALKIRFLLDPEVREFLKELEKYLRRIRIEVSREKDLVKGEVRGRIDWARTIQVWASTGFQDRTTLAISRPIRNYDIPENLVLKKTVTILNEFMNEKKVRREIERDYNWSKKLQERRRYIKGILRNVHFKRIMDAKAIHITPRMKSQVKRSRKRLYIESCRIFEKYQVVFLRHELSELLKDTFIDPDNVEKTYELFCLFMIIKTLDVIGWHVEKLEEIVADRGETAVLTQDEHEIRIFYNVTDPARLRFYDRAEPKETKKALQEITKSYFGKERQLTTRRPDIILEFRRGQVVKDYVVFEVKYTSNDDYVVEGVYQALHYLYDLKREDERVYFYKKSLGRGYNAAVIAYKLSPNIDKDNKVEDVNLKVKLLDFEDLADYTALIAFFRNFFEHQGLVIDGAKH